MVTGMGIKPQGVALWVILGVVVPCLLAGTASAKEGWKPLVGKRPPPFRVDQWLNTDGTDPQPASLDGKVWILQFLSVG